MLSSWWCSGTSLRDCISIRRCRTRSMGPWRVWMLFLILFKAIWPLPLCFRYNPVWGRTVVLLEALLYIQQPSSGSKESLSSLMMVTDVGRPSLLQSASRGVLCIVHDNPVKFLQAVCMPRPQPMITGTHWLLLRYFLFSSPTPCATLVISGCWFIRLVMRELTCPRSSPWERQ